MKHLILLIFIVFLNVQSRAATYYWVGNGGDWNDYNNHWATSSGGSLFYNQPPTANDDVVFDANSFSVASQIVSIDNGVFFCKNLSWSGVLHLPKFGIPGNLNFFTTTLRVFGSINMDTSMECSYEGLISCESPNAGNTISCAVNVPTGIVFNNPTGSWILLDTLHIRSVEMLSGTFNTNDQPVYSGAFISQYSQPKTINLGRSLIDTRDFQSWGPNTIIDADSSSIETEYFRSGSGQVFHNLRLEIYPSMAVMFTTDHCTYDTVIADNTSRFEISGGGNQIRYLKSLVPAQLGYTNYIHFGEFRNSLVMYSPNTFDTLALYNGGNNVEVPNGVQIEINNTILTSSDSCAGFVNLIGMPSSMGPQVIFSLNGPAVTVNKLAMRNVLFTGASITATHSLNHGNVNGVTITNPTSRTLFWVNGTGNWTDPAHWAAVSGGAGGFCIPTQADDVIFDANSLSPSTDTLYITGSGMSCHTLNATSLADTLTIDGGLTQQQGFYIHGSILLSPFVKWSYDGDLRFQTSDIGSVVSMGRAYFLDCYFNGTGSWILQDSLRGNRIFMQNGRLGTNGFSVRSLSEFKIEPQDTVIIDLSGSRLTSNSFSSYGNFAFNGQQGSMVAETINLGNPSEAHFFHLGALKVFNPTSIIGAYNFTIDTLETFAYLDMNAWDGLVKNGIFHKYVRMYYSNGLFEKMHLENDFEFRSDITADSVFLNNPGFTGQFYTNWSMNSLRFTYGLCDNYSRLFSDTTGVLSVSTGVVNANNLVLQNVHAQGGAVFNAVNSINQGNTSGWNFSGAAPDTTLYWIGGSGNWSEINHWSYTSGGSPAGCLPSPHTDVIFDENSFTANNTVLVDGSNIWVRNMTWINLTQPVSINDHPAVYYFNPNRINILGNLRLDPMLVCDYSGTFRMTGDVDKFIEPNGAAVKNMMIDCDPGTRIDLNGTLRISYIWFTHRSGNFYSNNNFMDLQAAEIYDTLRLGTSVVSTSWFASYAESGKIEGDSSIISGMEFRGARGNLFGKVTVYSTGNTSYIKGRNYSIKQLTTLGEVKLDNTDSLFVEEGLLRGKFIISGSNTRFRYAKADRELIMHNSTVFDTLFLDNEGYDFMLDHDSTARINDKFIANSSSHNNIFISSNLIGDEAFVVCNGDTVCLEFVSYRDIHAGGSAPFYGGQYSTDISNNAGISFTACVLPFSDVWPGDANSDGVVNNVDVLNIGLAYNETGSSRTGANLSWTAQSSQDWNRIFNGLVNYKHADCDGSGTINAFDTLAVSQNYSLTHALPLSGGSDEDQRVTGIDLSLVPASLNVLAGQFVSIPVKLGTPAIPATDVYGLAYTLHYDNARITPGSIYISYPSSWFTPNANRLPFSRNFFAQGYMDNAQSRTDLTNVSGNGTIAFINFQVLAGATGTIILELGNSTVVDQNGNDIAHNANMVTLNIVGSVGIQPIQEQRDYLLLYPNPAAENLHVSYSLFEAVHTHIEIHNLLGKKVYSSGELPAQLNADHEINISTLPVGIYELSLISENSRRTVRLVKSD